MTPLIGTVPAIAMISLLTLCACDGRDSAGVPAVGGDRDAHGCIGSAGYRWCAREAACVRPWELTAAKGIPSTEAAVNGWCAQP